jgi:PAS domain S-box-containing protein
MCLSFQSPVSLGVLLASISSNLTAIANHRIFEALICVRDNFNGNVIALPEWQTWRFVLIITVVLVCVILVGFVWRVRGLKTYAHGLEILIEKSTSELREASSQLEVEIQRRKRSEETLSKYAAEELERSEGRFKAAFESSAIGMGLLTLDGWILAVNDAVCEMSGYTKEELQQRNDSQNVYPPDAEIGMDLFAEMLEGKRGYYSVEKRYMHKSGEPFWTRLTLSMVRDFSGKPTYLVGMIENIEGQKRTLAELQKSEARFQAMFENAAIGIGLIGLDRRPLEVNAAFERITGYSSEELRRITGVGLSYPEDVNLGIPELQDVLAGKLDSYQVEKRYIRKNGEIYWVRLTNSVVRAADGKPQYMVTMIEDISERKHMLEELRRSQARFQAVFENAAVGIAVMGLDRRALEINPVAEKIVGYSAEELYNIDARKLALPEDLGVDTELFPDLISGKRNSFVMERRYRRKNGEIFWARINYSLVRDLEGNPDYLIGMIEDIDDQKRASERLAAQEAEHRRILEQRIAERTEELNKANKLLQQKATQEAVTTERTRLARDLHDAVTQTLFSATLIADVLPDIWQMNSEEGRRRLEELRQLTRGALAEMRTLLVELRPNALVEVPLPTLLRQLSEALTGRARIDIQFTFEGERQLPPDVQVALYRIAQEALNNAVKHSKASQAAIMLRLGDQVRLSVTDNGMGFEPANVTADHLGLKIMCERSEAIRAKFSLYSMPGEGTQVTVTWQDKEIR